VLNGGSVSVETGGVVSTTHISSGGSEVVQGTDLSAFVSSGATISANFSGVISNTTVLNGGSAYIGNQGVASNASLLSGGFLEVSAGGSTVLTQVQGGGSASPPDSTIKLAPLSSVVLLTKPEEATFNVRPLWTVTPLSA
jgi:autotransporter passenger strand-loop-strand repeat protein